MSKYRNNLPQLGERRFITDGGLETVMCFQKDIELPEFASYDLLKTDSGRQLLKDYYDDYFAIAKTYRVGLLLETPTWRANADWGQIIGDSREDLARLNRAAVDFLIDLRADHDSDETPVVISGNIGPRGDGYSPDSTMSAEEAEDYHGEQIAVFADSAADMVGALTINYLDEAVGITRAARRHNMPLCVSFTVETDGKLPTGEGVDAAIQAVDEASGGWPAYYMINCAHPSHFRHLFNRQEPWVQRLRGVRGNASKMSHEELDNAETLDDGNPLEFGAEVVEMHQLLPALNVLGGCCGTDHRHIEAICRSAA